MLKSGSGLGLFVWEKRHTQLKREEDMRLRIKNKIKNNKEIIF